MAESDAHPITVAIERRIDPTRAAQATAWMQAGTDLAQTFEGFLGSGWVRAGENSDLWYMLYRFRDIPTLESWEDSGERRWWLESGRGFASEGRSERRTGIEGWFDAPLATNVDTRMPEAHAPAGAGVHAETPRRAMPSATGPIQRPIPVAPPRWKQAVTIWLGFFPTNLVASWLLGFVPGFMEWPLAARVLLTSILLTPVMIYAVLPWVTRALGPWLQKSP
ncbi:MAG TPA: antibiotic biosynthesis monooxygenase [Microbacterium sp.]|uniref:antibiotic biosynthesis monooxygenase n=1 Tax=Microbacterium sp. TaxID=51671 RepID=UPI002B605431|nr:antibiotic biosynthesis monooxygenase [Microbacterium sp.]HWI32463.1 antibiotic biosynthesis monooxygenase [Microbacterium sp.]